MSDRNHPGDNIEMRLDRLIDALNAGVPPSSIAGDPELRDLADVVRATDSVRETQWPRAGYGKRLAAQLSSQLQEPLQHVPGGGNARLFDLPEAPASLNGRVDIPAHPSGTGLLDLAWPRRGSRLKVAAQMAAALAGFALLTFVLITVFRGAPDDQNLGIAPPALTSTALFAASPTPGITGTAAPTPESGQMPLIPTPPSTPDATISIVPYELTCDANAAITGSGFVPGSRVDILLGDYPIEAPDGSAIASITAGEDGTVRFDELIAAGTLIPNCEAVAAAGRGEIIFGAASIISEDGAQRYAQPVARTPVLLQPTGGTSEVPSQIESTATTLSLQPEIVTCDATVTVIGTGFEPGTRVTLLAFQIPGDNGINLETQPEVGADGTFAVDLPVANRIVPCGMDGVTDIEIPEAGLIYGIDAMTGTGPKPDGDDWREPSAHAILTVVPNAEHASPKALEQLMVDQAVAAAREFLGEPEAEFEALRVVRDERRHVRIGRQVEEAYDEFTYDVDFRRFVNATIQSHASGWSPVQPIDADEAMQIAVEVASAGHPFFDDLTLYESNDQGTIPGRDGEQDRIFTATWQMQTRTDPPIWLPTVLTVGVDMETGLVTGYHYSFEPYFGPMAPAIQESDAVAAVEDAIATEPTLNGATVGKVELTTSYKVLETDDTGAVTAGEWILVWRIHLENAPESAPAPFIEADALTGELLIDFGEPGGAG